jgi:hypothetical protein
MNKRIFGTLVGAVAVMLCVAATASAQYDVFTEDFESPTSAVFTSHSLLGAQSWPRECGGSYGHVSSCAAIIEVPDYKASRTALTQTDAGLGRGTGRLTLSFWQRRLMGVGSSLKVQDSINGGPWSTVRTFTTSTAGSLYHHTTIHGHQIAKGNSYKIRFLLRTANNMHGFADVALDDINLTDTAGAPPKK